MRLGRGTFSLSVNEARASCMNSNQPTQKQKSPGFHRGRHVLGAQAGLFLLTY